MFIKKLDYLSPSITFYYQGAQSHTSIISGIISIISIIIIIVFSLYYFHELIIRKNPNSFYFRSFIEDAGTFPINASSFFHFLSLGVINDKGDWKEGVNFTDFRIVGIDYYFNNYVNDRNISHFDHWLYGICNNNSDTEGISHLINYKYFEKSACIKNPKFRWPVLSHGTYKTNNQFYSIVVEECKNDTINLILGGNQKCINNPLIRIQTSYFYFINHYINIFKYKNPTIKFLDRIENGINKNNYYLNNINIFPSNVKTHNGYIFEKVEEEKGYIYERNDVITQINKEDVIYVAFNIWLKNIVNDYDRNYKKIQDVFSNIGGINQVVIFISIWLNKFYNNYIELTDTDELLFSSIKTRNNDKRKQINRKITRNKFEELNKEKNNNLYKKSFEKEKNREKIDKRIGRNQLNSNLSKSQNNFFNTSEKLNQNYMNYMKSSDDKDKINNNNLYSKYKKISTKISEEKKNFCKYILFKILCGKKYKWFGIYNNFRKKIISEEHLIKNYLNIYNLLKDKEKTKRFKHNAYSLKDLINLV